MRMAIYFLTSIPFDDLTGFDMVGRMWGWSSDFLGWFKVCFVRFLSRLKDVCKRGMWDFLLVVD